MLTKSDEIKLIDPYFSHKYTIQSNLKWRKNVSGRSTSWYFERLFQSSSTKDAYIVNKRFLYFWKHQFIYVRLFFLFNILIKIINIYTTLPDQNPRSATVYRYDGLRISASNFSPCKFNKKFCSFCKLIIFSG